MEYPAFIRAPRQAKPAYPILLSALLLSGGTLLALSSPAAAQAQGTPSPLQIVQTLSAEEGGINDWFGHAVALSGQTAVIGVPQNDDAGRNAGTAYVFHFDGERWQQRAKLQPDNLRGGAQFGYSVAVHGNTIAIGAPGYQHSAGTVFLYEQHGDQWSLQRQLTADDGEHGDLFGQTLALSESHIAVGAPDNDNAGQNAGAVYVFNQSNDAPAQQLKAHDAVSYDRFGSALAVSGSRLLIGAPEHDGVALDSGAAYLYRFERGEWQFDNQLQPPSLQFQDNYGTAVALHGDWAAVGAPRQDSRSESKTQADRGSVHLFTHSATGWRHQTRLQAKDGNAYDYFGSALALQNRQLLVGVPDHDSAGRNAGAAYLFQQQGTQWQQISKLTATEEYSALSGRFGLSLSLSGQHALIGARLNNRYKGAAHITSAIPSSSATASHRLLSMQ